MTFLLSIIPTIIVLGILIIIHEFGHFMACRLTGVEVEKFSIGFGPEILHWQGKKTRYVVSLFPLGGFVKPAGESISEVEDKGPNPGDYLAAPLAARIFIVCAGVIMNYLLAFVIFSAMFMIGRPVPGTTIGDFVEGYPAAASGLLKGDRIVSVMDKEVSTWADMTDALQAAPEGPIQLRVERTSGETANELLPIAVTPVSEDVPDVLGDKVKLRRLGIIPHPEARYFQKYGFIEAVKNGFTTTVTMTVMTHKAIFYMIMGKLSVKAISGPVGIISMTGTAAQLGLPYLLQLTGTLSISLAVVNLLPIPALDGGHLLFLLIEAIRRKKVSLQVQERVTQIGFTLLLMLMVFLVYNDLVNIDAFGKLKRLFGA